MSNASMPVEEEAVVELHQARRCCFSTEGVVG